VYLVEIVLLSLTFPLITVLCFFRYRRSKLRGRELLVLKEEQKKDNIEIKDNFDVSVKNKWHRIKISFKRRVSSLDEYKKQFNPEHHCYRLSILDNSKEPVYVEERSITDFFGFCWYQGFGEKKKSLDSICEAVLLEFLLPEPGTYTLVFQLKTKEECSEIKDVVLRVNEGVRPQPKESGVHNRIDLKKKKTAKEPEQEEEHKEKQQKFNQEI
jgi:hypothetical protein